MRVPGGDKAIANLLAWTKRPEWRARYLETVEAHFGPACDELGMTEDEIIETVGAGYMTMLDAFILEHFFSARFDDGANIIDDYLKRRGWREIVPAKRYLAAMRDSTASLYEVVDVAPGSHVVVRDVLRGGAPIAVDERLGSQSVAQWDHIVVRVVQLGDRHGFTGAILPFEQDAADDLRDALAAALRRAQKDARAWAKEQDEPFAEAEAVDLFGGIFLDVVAPLVSAAWLVDAVTRLKRPPPEIRTAENDPVVFAEVRFPLAGGAAEIERRLDACEALAREPGADDRADAQWSWLERNDENADRRGGARRAQDGIVFDTFDPDSVRILGSIALADGRLTLSAKSAQRAERGRGLLAAILPGLVGEPETELTPLEVVLKERSGTPLPKPDIPAEEMERLLHGYMDRHYRDTLDKPLAALGNRTPRQLARTKRGRPRVVSWLKKLENAEFRRARDEGRRPYDARWMWEELGLLGLRG